MYMYTYFLTCSGQKWLRHPHIFQSAVSECARPTGCFAEAIQREASQREASVLAALCPSGNQPAPSCLPCSRLSLLEEWRGVRDQALSELSGIKDCIFVHASGFIGGNKTQEGVLEMARRTLQAAACSPANGDS